MSPRPAPTRHDAVAIRYLDAAADLIDTYLQPEPRGQQKLGRLRSIKFPAALEWLRTQDVIRMVAAQGNEGGSRNAFYKRWATRDEFLADAVVYAMMRE